MFSLKVDAEIELALLENRHVHCLAKLVDDNRAYLKERLSWLDIMASVADAERFIAHSLKLFSETKGQNTGIFYQGNLVGMISLAEIDHADRSTTIGYWLAEDQQKKGIMRRACSALVDYCFNELNLHRVVIRVEVDNDKSHAIPQALGFVAEGTLYQVDWLYDHYIDVVVYSKLSTDLNK